jgi:hypothetical protein
MRQFRPMANIKPAPFTFRRVFGKGPRRKMFTVCLNPNCRVNNMGMFVAGLCGVKCPACGRQTSWSAFEYRRHREFGRQLIAQGVILERLVMDSKGNIVGNLEGSRNAV